MKVLHLAPHMSWPPVNGADKRAWNLFCGIRDRWKESEFIGRQSFSDCGLDHQYHSRTNLWRDNKNPAAVISILLFRDYWQQRHLSTEVRKKVRASARTPVDAVLVSFLYSVPLLREVPGNYSLFVDSHNFDPDYFSKCSQGTRNPLLRFLCRRAVETSLTALRGLPKKTLLFHVSDSDADQYRALRPDLRHVVIENGCDVRPRVLKPEYSAIWPKQLVFVGSLSSKMNLDALQYFAARFWATLKQFTEVTIVGSNPTTKIRNLCITHGWKLRPNVTEQELQSIYEGAHYSILPFAYGAGSKLKLFEACGRGIPVLSTIAGVTGVVVPPPLVFSSDLPEAWKRNILERNDVSADEFDQTIAFARRFSWTTLAQRLVDYIEPVPVRRDEGAELQWESGL